MKTKISILTLAFCLAVGTVCFAAAGPEMGRWRLNEAKSKFAPGAAKNRTVVYSAAGDKVKVTVDGIDGSGKKAHNEWTGKFDGRDYAVTGDPASDTRAYTRVNDHTLAMTVRKSGKTMATGRIVVAADGKSRTVTTTSTNGKGKKLSTKAVYDKK